MKYYCLSLLCLFCGILTAIGQNDLKTTELNVFKNGTYFVVKEGTVKVEDGKAKLDIPRNPLLGTFWLTTAKDVAINKVIFINDTLKNQRKATTIPELLKSNKGKKVKLNYRVDEKSFADISGTLLDYFFASNIVKLKTADGKYAYLPAGDIRQFFVEETPVETYQADSTTYLANIEFNHDIREARLKLVYMQAGIQWIPSYNIKVINDKELQLEMRALVENFAEVVRDADLSLVVGDPNYKYGRNIEPFAVPYLTSIAGAPAAATRYAYQNAMNAPRSMAAQDYSYSGAPAAVPQPVYDDYQVYTTEGEKTNDLYMYKMGKVSIPKFSKASFQVFSQKIPYKDLYKVTVSDAINYAGTYYINNDPERKFDVYHSLRLTNGTKNPFTTAPVFVMDENLQPLAQDEIKYTPVTGSVTVQLSKSPDIIVKDNEEEIKRDEREKTVNKVTYSKITIKGKIEVTNLQSKKIILNLDKYVNALITEVSDKGEIKKPPRFYGLNPSCQVTWEIPMNENEKKSLSYTYEVYIQAR
jgi:hypothetical protein